MAGERLTWALLAPVSRNRLADLVRAYWRQEISEYDDDYEAEGWQVIGGMGDYSAVLDRNPGSEYTHETRLAERISSELKRPVYVLYLNERFGDADPVSVYEDGQETSQRSLPYELARSLGVAFPGAEKTGPVSVGRPVDGVIVVEGVSAAQVARALDMSEPPRGPVHIEDGPIGAIMYNEATISPPLAMPCLSNAFPEASVYTLGKNPLGGRFLVWVMRGGEDVGIFEVPAAPAADESTTVLDSVKGETTPRGIAAALGVPEGLMDLP